MSHIEIFIPCDEYSVRVRVGPSTNLSPLEILFLRAIIEDTRTNIHALASLFSIGLRPTLDIVFDLWKRGHLMIDTSSGSIHVSNYVNEAHMRDPHLPTLQGGREWEEERPVLLDRIGGQVISAHQRRENLRKRLPESPGIAPANYFDVSLRDVTSTQLLSALRYVVEQEESWTFNQRRSAPQAPENTSSAAQSGDAELERSGVCILGANLSLSERNSAPKRCWLKLDVRCMQLPSGNFQFEFVDSPVPASVAVRIQRRLALLAEGVPDSAFVRYLTGQAQQEDAAPYDSDLARLEVKVDELADCNPGLRSDRQAECVKLMKRLESQWAYSPQTDFSTRPLFSEDDHLVATRDMIQKAKHQIILTSPQLDYKKLHILASDLLECLSRGVQVFLLWGYAASETLEAQYKPISNLFMPLKTAFPRRFFFPQRSCRVNGNVVIQDDRRILVTGKRLLVPPRTTGLEYGLLAASGSTSNSDFRRRPFPLADTALEWAWQQYPDYEDKLLMYRSFSEFPREGQPGDGELFEATCPIRPPSPPEMTTSKDSFDLEPCSVRLWQESWRDICQMFRERLAHLQTAPRAELVLNRAHRDVLNEAIRDARTRLLISSDRLGLDVVTDGFLSQLESALSRGVLISLLFQRQSVGSEQLQADVMRSLTNLSERNHVSGRLRIIQTDYVSRLLVMDDTIVASSFDFLSNAGSSGDTQSAAINDRRSEVGMLIRDARIANTIVSNIRSSEPNAVESWPDAIITEQKSMPLEVSHEQHPSLPDLQRLMSELRQRWSTIRLQDRDSSAECDEHIPSLPSMSSSHRETLNSRNNARPTGVLAVSSDRIRPYLSRDLIVWTILDRLQKSAFPKELLRIAVAIALEIHETDCSEAAGLWRQWLAEDAWQQHRFTEAGVLVNAGFSKNSELLPSPLIVLLAAGWQCRVVAYVLKQIVEQNSSTDLERRIAAVCSLGDFILDDHDATGYDCFEEFRGNLPEVWKSIGNAYDQYFKAVWQPMPMRTIRMHKSSTDLKNRLSDAWKSLECELAEGERVYFKFVSGTKTHEWLFREDGHVFGRLRLYQREQNADGLHDWLQPDKGHPWIDNMGDLIDYATAQVDDADRCIGQKDGLNKRRSYLKTLNGIAEAARSVDALAVVTRTESKTGHIAVAKEFAMKLSQQWPAVLEHLNSLDGPERVITELVMRDLRPVVEWGTHK